jgi:hypothetical protein
MTENIQNQTTQTMMIPAIINQRSLRAYPMAEPVEIQRRLDTALRLATEIRLLNQTQ